MTSEGIDPIGWIKYDYVATDRIFKVRGAAVRDDLAYNADHVMVHVEVEGELGERRRRRNIPRCEKTGGHGSRRRSGTT